MTKSAGGIRWRDALDLKLREEFRAPVISIYQLAVELLRLTSMEFYGDRRLIQPKRPVDRLMLNQAKSALIRRGALLVDKSLPSTILRFPGKKGTTTEQTLCAIDPFIYIAYLSAMSFHGLTNRLPKIVLCVSPEPSLWTAMAAERMAKDLTGIEEHFHQSNLPQLRHSSIKRLDGMTIEEVRTKTPGGWRYAHDQTVRVTGVGKTFLDMLQRPELCGGIRHVIEVYEEHAKSNLQSIISEVSNNGAKIDKIRAGYILETYCQVDDERIDAWTINASRGGSRKLDPQSEYSPNFSERWSLSINV